MNSPAHNMYVVVSQLKSFKLARAERKFQVNYSDMSVNSHILILDFSFYRTQVSLGSGLWVPVSLTPYLQDFFETGG